MKHLWVILTRINSTLNSHNMEIKKLNTLYDNLIKDDDIRSFILSDILIKLRVN